MLLATLMIAGCSAPAAVSHEETVPVPVAASPTPTPAVPEITGFVLYGPLVWPRKIILGWDSPSQETQYYIVDYRATGETPDVGGEFSCRHEGSDVLPASVQSCTIDRLWPLGEYEWTVTGFQGHYEDRQGIQTLIMDTVTAKSAPQRFQTTSLFQLVLETAEMRGNELLVTWNGAQPSPTIAYSVALRPTCEACEALRINKTCSSPCVLRPPGGEYDVQVFAYNPESGSGRIAQTESQRLTVPGPARPIVFLHGWQGSPTTWEYAAAQAYGVLNFSSVRGSEILAYQPTTSVHTIEELAANVVQHAISDALCAEGFEGGNGRCDDVPVDIVAHSMGGLVARVLVEKAGQENATWRIRNDWTVRVRSITMVGTPNHGSELASDGGCAAMTVWAETCYQMIPASGFYTSTLTSPSSEQARKYRTVAGDVGDYSDGVVRVDSVALPGVPSYVFQGTCHDYSMCGLQALTHREDALRVILPPSTLLAR